MSHEEIEVLQTIYNNDFTTSNALPVWYGVMVSSNEGQFAESSHSQRQANEMSIVEPQYIQILFNIPLGYPSVPLEIIVVSPLLSIDQSSPNSSPASTDDDNDPVVNDENCPIHLEKILKDRAKELASLEEPAIFEIIELARGWLWNYQQKSSSYQCQQPFSSYWIGEWPNILFDWQIASYSPSRIMGIQFETELKVIEHVEEETGVRIDISRVRDCLRMNLWDVTRTVRSVVKSVNENALENVKEVIEEDVAEKICAICFDTFPPEETTIFVPCGHSTCNDCLTQYLSLKISENQIFSMNCPGAIKCRTLVSPIILGRLLSKQLINKYYSCLGDSFNQLQQHPEIPKTNIHKQSVKKFWWCINPKCNHSISVKLPSLQQNPSLLHCYGCSTTWCSSCELIGGHWPSTCTDHDLYLRTNHTVNLPSRLPQRKPYTDISTKPCPNCRIHISKNGGCMHMTCRMCHYEFCWGCLKEWAYRSHSTLFTCDAENSERENDDGLTMFSVFELDDIQSTPGQFQKRFKGGAVLHSAALKQEQAELDLLLRHYRSGTDTRSIRRLRIEITGLLVQLNYIMKFGSMGFFTKSSRDELELKKAMEIMLRLELGLRTAENLRDQVMRIDRTNVDKGDFEASDETRLQGLREEMEKCKERLGSNIKKMAKILYKMDQI
ncbi:15993_t:CDS:1 [Acaulospora colombiana]|uniref:15993_t:CDS:1 n=1 Tax=Acaulospora colombiana TaxID=27376 RepID=A0ACA9KAP8_9GLOM|nr:15993_t:CDS:1 [Acaulospora colombiana]